jgi:hypothetical protein
MRLSRSQCEDVDVESCLANLGRLADVAIMSASPVAPPAPAATGWSALASLSKAELLEVVLSLQKIIDLRDRVSAPATVAAQVEVEVAVTAAQVEVEVTRLLLASA